MWTKIKTWFLELFESEDAWIKQKEAEFKAEWEKATSQATPVPPEPVKPPVANPSGSTEVK